MTFPLYKTPLPTGRSGQLPACSVYRVCIDPATAVIGVSGPAVGDDSARPPSPASPAEKMPTLPAIVNKTIPKECWLKPDARGSMGSAQNELILSSFSFCKQGWEAGSMLGQRWANVFNVGPALSQHWVLFRERAFTLTRAWRHGW